MKRKDYQKPSMTVIRLQVEAPLLTASNEVDATMNTEWTEENI